MKNCGGMDCIYPACDCTERPPRTMPVPKSLRVPPEASAPEENSRCPDAVRAALDKSGAKI